MANIKKRGNTFKIRAYVGTDMNGKKIIKSTTFIPPQGVSDKKAEKLAQEFAFEYERQCRGYIQFNDSMRFSELADWYFTNYAGVELKDSTIYTYQGQYKNHIGKKVRTLREERKMSQQQLSNKLELEGVYVCRGSVSRIEDRSRTVTDIELEAIARVLSVGIEEMFE